MGKKFLKFSPYTKYSIFYLIFSIYCGIINLLLNLCDSQTEGHTLFKFVRSQKV